jgi:arylsulfatase A-like enzyme
LYVTADDLGTRLGAYGHQDISTPRIDAFASDALLFEDCHCQVGICGPSRVSILTGLRPETTGVLRNDDAWRSAAPEARTLPRHFRDSGYRTYAVGKINDERNGPLDDAWTSDPTAGSVWSIGQVTDLLEDVAAEHRTSDQPFFVAIGFNEPHCPWEPSQASLDAYQEAGVRAELGPGRTVSASYLERCSPQTLPEAGGVEAGEAAEEVELTDAEAEDLALRYLASVSDLDEMFGAVLDTAEQLEMLDNTIVIFWSGDHGYALGDAGHWGKWTPFESVTRIPLIMSLPDRRGAGARATGMVEAVDMYPTLVELCGLEAPPQALDGMSMVQLFDRPDQAWKDVVFSRFGRRRAVKTATHNLMKDDFWGTVELFDRTVEELPENDLTDELPDEAARLEALLEAGPPKP